MVNDSTDADLYDHVGHDFSIVHEIVKSLVVGNSTTVVTLVRQLDDMLGDVQTQEYNEDKERLVRTLLDELDEEAAAEETDITPADAQRVREGVEHALEAYQVAALKKDKHPENQ